ncbi:ParB N-terminal domain-containing protein [Actinosynnema sp. NPDC023587]|uniref:ParB/RepB/Spo0J family partition protein n=1 Tax=Actinosynnema sp. NPDC023587 TaxID=3154695 RepID=UPI0034035C42
MSEQSWSNTRFELLDPRMLVLDRNSRTIGDIEAEKPDLCASVRRHGVRIPVIVHPAEDGRYRVQDGHCRTIIAISLPGEDLLIPAIVTESDDVRQWRWLRDQWLANEVRSGYDTADTARIFEELTLFGLSVEEVADELSVGVESVEAGLRTRRSEKATTALRDFPQLSLLQAAELAEFEDDEDAYRELVDTLEADPAGFDHALAEWHQEYRLRDARDELAATVRAAGVEVVGDTMPAGAQRLDRLYRGRKDRTRLDDKAAGHESCPGHAAIVTSNTLAGTATAIHLCRDWASHGHVEVWSVNPQASASPEWTPERKAARVRVLRNNKAWRAAETVRHTALRTLLAGSPPRAAGQFIARSLVEGDHELRRAMERNHVFACRLLDLKESKGGGRNPLSQKLTKANADQATMVALAVVLAAFEASTSVETWRTPTPEQKRYFAALAKWGIRLHWVEQLVNDPTADAHLAVDTDLDPVDAGDEPVDPVQADSDGRSLDAADDQAA